MSMAKGIRWILACLAVAVVLPASAQFYSNGASPAGLNWRMTEGRRVSVLAPDYAAPLAHKVLYLMDSLSTSIGYGLLPDRVVEPLWMPVVMHTENSASNGISIVAPRRIEMCAMPDRESYATPWLRQLSVHEYRHAAQYGALFDGWASRALYVLLGEQSLLAITGVMPFWWLEGDAVAAETEAALFGRALQPSFTMHYRAVGRKILEGGNPDKWFVGSYNEYIPNHYNLGYQMVTTANTLQGRYAWGEIMDYAREHPYTITPFEWAMRKRWGMTTAALFRQTFQRLNDHWESLPEREDSAQRVYTPKHSPYQSTKYPLWVSDNEVVAVESSFDRSAALVKIDVATGARKVLHYIGGLNTRPVLIGDYIYWTEAQQLASFAQQIGSVMCRARTDGRGGVERVLPKSEYALYPVAFGGDVAYVRYNFVGTYTIVCTEGEFTLPEGVECHGLTVEGDHLYLLTTSDRGMAIERLEPSSGTWQTIKEPSRVTLSSLTAEGGKLYFGSIASGYDEVHSIDLRSGSEVRLTSSRYGSFYGAPSPNGERLAVAVYDADGYHLAVGTIAPIERVEQSLLPRNIVNPDHYRWENMVCIDTIAYDSAQANKQRAKYPSVPYNEAAGAMNFHSWAPIYYRPDQLMSGNLADVKFGATVVSQSLLSDAISSVGLYVLPSGNVGTSLNVKYLGWAPKLELDARLSTAPAGSYDPVGVMMKGGNYYDYYDHSEQVAERPSVRRSASLYGRAYLPFLLSNSYVTTTLTPAVEYSFSNKSFYSPTSGYHSGMHALAATLQWNSYTRSAYRNLNPRWGVAFVGGVGKCLMPFESPTTLGVYARINTPAFGANDGFTVRASYQDIVGNGPIGCALDFGWLSPRGMRSSVYPDDLVGGSVQYDAPLCYPDLGIRGVVMLKRVRASLFVDTLWGRLWTEDGSRQWGGATTFGGDVYLDTSWLRLPPQGDLSIKLGLYFDTQFLSEPTFTGGLALNF